MSYRAPRRRGEWPRSIGVRVRLRLDIADAIVPTPRVRAGNAARVARALLYAALALEPPLGLVSVVPPVPPLLLESDDFLLSSLFVEPVSLDSVFAGDFVSLAVDLDSELEGLLEP